MIGIYKITSPTGKVYIGQTWNIKKRRGDYEKQTCKSQPKIYNSLVRHGWRNHQFEIIHELPRDVHQDVLDGYELFYWAQYRNCGFEMLNLKEPGKGGKHSTESIQKMVQKAQNRCIPDEVKSRISKTLLGKLKGPMKEETKEKLRAAMLGRTPSESTKKKQEVARLRRQLSKKPWHTEEAIQKIRNAKNQRNPMPRVSCPHCEKVGDIGNMQRWHLNNCKYKI